MKYILCHGAIYKLSEDKYKEALTSFAQGGQVFLSNFGVRTAFRPLSEPLTDMTNMTRHEAQQIIGGS